MTTSLFVGLFAFYILLIPSNAVQVSLSRKDVLYLPKSQDLPPDMQFEFDFGLAEQIAYDPTCRIIYAVGANVIHVIQIDRDLQLTLLDLKTFEDTVKFTSVRTCGRYVYVAAVDESSPLNGKVHIFRRYSKNNKDLNPIRTITVGSGPDAIQVTGNCKKIVVAVEGEPLDSVNPEGLVELIEFRYRDLSRSPVRQTAIDFKEFDNRASELEEQGLIYADKSGPLRFDLEPEFICLDKRECYAYVTLQDNNAIAVIDLRRRKAQDIFGLGFKDHSVPGQGLDPSDDDGGINIGTWPVFGMYQPDGIACINVGKKTYMMTANEGDLREDDEERIKNVLLDETAFPPGLDLQNDAKLGRLEIHLRKGDTDGDGEFEELYAAGGRSVSLWNSKGTLIADTGDKIEQILAQQVPEIFNADNDEDFEADVRSDKKGPETESLASFCICKGRYEAVFAGNEKPGFLVIATLDRRNLGAGFTLHGIVEGIPVKDGSKDAETQYNEKIVSLLDPEGIMVIEGKYSPTRKPLLVTSASVTGTVSVFEINVDCRAK